MLQVMWKLLYVYGIWQPGHKYQVCVGLAPLRSIFNKCFSFKTVFYMTFSWLLALDIPVGCHLEAYGMWPSQEVTVLLRIFLSYVPRNGPTAVMCCLNYNSRSP